VKGRQHLALGIITAFAIFFFVSIKFDSTFFDGFYLLFLFGIVLGSILPDADSRDRGSFIFYTVFQPIAFVLNKLGPGLARRAKRSWDHRGFFHEPKGMFLTSLISGALLSLVFVIFALSLFPGTFIENQPLYLIIVSCIIVFIGLTLIFALGVFIGQLTHLLQDFLESPIGYLVILVLFIIVLNLILNVLGI
jgi:hypothetical protein